MSEASTRRLKMPVAVTRQMLLDDEATQEIATHLGLDLADYVELVMDYALSGREPEVEVLDEESMEALGPEIPSEQDVLSWIESVRTGEISLEAPVTISDDRVEHGDSANGALEKRAPTVHQLGQGRPRKAGEVLRQQLRAQQRLSERVLSSGSGTS